MNRSDEISELITALAQAQSKFTVVPKNKTATVRTKTGGEYKYQYADLADVLSMALPILSTNGLALSQPHLIIGGKLRVATLLLHTSGQWMQSDGIEISEDGDPQQFGAESTYFRRYDVCSFIGVAPDEDTDAQQGSERKRKAEVYAEIERQKRQFDPAGQDHAYHPLEITPQSPQDAPQAIIPPELDWSYNKASGVLICRVLDAKLGKKKDGKTELLTLQINNKLDANQKKPVLFYFHATHRELLLNAIGKVIKAEITASGDFFHLQNVLEVDGLPIPQESTEVQVRLLASTLDLTEEDLKNSLLIYKTWPVVLQNLQTLKARRETEQPA